MPADERVRERRRSLLRGHLEAEAQGNLSAVLDTFARNTEMIYNGQLFTSHDHVRQAHVYMGFSGEGAIQNLGLIVDRESFTDEEIVIEARIVGVHGGEFRGFVGTGRAIELPVVAFYRFDEDDKLASERIVMNLGTLGASPTWQPS